MAGIAQPEVTIFRGNIRNIKDDKDYLFTIRNAKWLSRIIGPLMKKWPPKDKDLEYLWWWCIQYSRWEIIWELSGNELPVNTTRLDRAFTSDDPTDIRDILIDIVDFDVKNKTRFFPESEKRLKNGGEK